ncbi:MAG TPA: ABC transporter permease [Gaiellaceae bacterium]|nr:ABC transporter permease [Gaiellaceae bacterium]
MRVARLLWKSLLFQLKSLTLTSFFWGVTLITPVIVATIAFYMFRAGEQEGTLLYAALGAGLMGVWSSVLFGSGGAIQWERWMGTLEILVAAPAPLLLVLAPLTVATAAFGLYSLAATVLWGRLLFGIPFELEHPLLFALALPATVIGLGLLGLVLAASFVLYRQASALSNLFEEPVWLVTGLLVPVSLLPGWIEPLSWILAPTWGVRAIRESALGGDPLTAIGMCLALATVYLAAAALLLRHFERRARERATLSLT